MRLLLTFVLMCGVGLGSDVKVDTDESIALNEKFEYVNDEVSISKTGTITVRGKIKNKSDVTYDLVVVKITAKDESGAVLRDDTVNAKPLTITPGSESVVKVLLRPKNKAAKPAVIEWSVVSAMERKSGG